MIGWLLKKLVVSPGYIANYGYTDGSGDWYIVVDSDKCDGCGTCKDTCPVSVFEIVDAKSKAANVKDCLVCRACEVQCPNQAIQVIE